MSCQGDKAQDTLLVELMLECKHLCEKMAKYFEEHNFNRFSLSYINAILDSILSSIHTHIAYRLDNFDPLTLPFAILGFFCYIPHFIVLSLDIYKELMKDSNDEKEKKEYENLKIDWYEKICSWVSRLNWLITSTLSLSISLENFRLNIQHASSFSNFMKHIPGLRELSLILDCLIVAALSFDIISSLGLYLYAGWCQNNTFNIQNEKSKLAFKVEVFLIKLLFAVAYTMAFAFVVSTHIASPITAMALSIGLYQLNKWVNDTYLPKREVEYAYNPEDLLREKLIAHIDKFRLELEEACNVLGQNSQFKDAANKKMELYNSLNTKNDTVTLLGDLIKASKAKINSKEIPESYKDLKNINTFFKCRME